MKKTKIIYTVIIAAVFMMLFASCDASKGPDKALSEIMDEIIEKCSISDEIELEIADLLDYYGIKGEDVAESAACVTMNGIFPDEIIMVKAKDGDAASRIQKCLETRLNEVMNQSKNYDAESYAVAQKCKVDVRGEYIAFFVSAKHEDMTKIYSAHF